MSCLLSARALFLRLCSNHFSLSLLLVFLPVLDVVFVTTVILPQYASVKFSVRESESPTLLVLFDDDFSQLFHTSVILGNVTSKLA